MIGGGSSRSYQAFLLAIFLTCLFELARGHGRLVQPPSRVSLFRNPKFFDIATKKRLQDYDDMGKNCGGKQIQWSQNGGKCGICGDRWDKKLRPQEAPNGHFAQGIIVEQYKTGEVIEVTVELTANHNGWFQFRLCPDPEIEADQDCLDKHVLQLADGSGTTFKVAPWPASSQTIQLRLPAGLTCDRCVLQWKYHAGNDWGIDPQTGIECRGCKPEQEEFYACADVKIGDGSNAEPLTDKPTTKTNEPVTDKPTTKNVPKCTGAGSLKDSLEVAKRCEEACASGCCPAQLCSEACGTGAP